MRVIMSSQGRQDLYDGKIKPTPDRDQGRTCTRSVWRGGVVLLKATLDLLTEGADAVSIAAVARRAGVHELSVYRCRGTKAKLALEALLAYSAQETRLKHSSRHKQL
jgi:hypothetical protein